MKAGLYFVLGARDFEMDAIETLLAQELQAGKISGYGFAVATGKRVHPGNAYKAELVQNVSGSQLGSELVMVECALADESQNTIVRVDHHRPGDPGFGRPAVEAVNASSLGQILAILVLEPNLGQKAISAADHNLAAAYAGQVPEVTADMVLTVRLPELMFRNNASESDVRAGIEAAAALLLRVPFVQIGVSQVRDLRAFGVQPYVSEAATRAGIEFIGRVDTRSPEKIFLSGNSATVAAFMANPLVGITGIYGDPARGFAGGTQTL